MFLCEAGLDYEFKPINIRAGEQHSAEFRAINPAGKVPVIWDGDMHQTESNSILLSLAQKTGWGLMEGSSLNAKIDRLALLSGIDSRAIFRTDRILVQVRQRRPIQTHWPNTALSQIARLNI